MRSPSAWQRLASSLPSRSRGRWLEGVLAANAGCDYLRRHDSPVDLREFRERLPVVSYDDLAPWMERIRAGEPDVLFAGRPVAYERTGGSSGGAKLIPYTAAGLEDFRRAIVPWLAGAATRHGVTGKAYFSISPATRAAEQVGGVPVGLPDGAYLGEAAAAALAELSAVPFELAFLPEIARWREQTLKHLAAARELELISIWSPTFLLRLLDALPDPRELWPNLKLVSCWASAASRSAAAELAARLPHAHLQPKGLLSTECVVTVPNERDQPVLVEDGFFEFEREGRFLLRDELAVGEVYGVVATTASGLYRYRTGDLVRCDAVSGPGRPVLEFVGRGTLVSDLVGEKLDEAFVERCLQDVPGFRLLVPGAAGRGYELAIEAGIDVSPEHIEARLFRNPQYAYARCLGQLEPLRLLPVEHLYDRYVEAQLERGVRLGDVKPVALRCERGWAQRFGSQA